MMNIEQAGGTFDRILVKAKQQISLMALRIRSHNTHEIFLFVVFHFGTFITFNGCSSPIFLL